MVTYDIRRGRVLMRAVGIAALVLLLAGGAGAATLTVYDDGGGVAPVEEWNRTYGGQHSDSANWIQQTTDGGFIITGGTNSYKDFFGDILLIKTDRNGDILWNKTFGGSGTDYANYVQQTSDGGYIIAGAKVKPDNSSDGYTVLNSDAWLIKTDSSGDEQWNRTFGEKGNDYARFVQQTSDGGYIMAGAKSLYGIGYDNNAWLIKTDASGNEQWNRTFGETNIAYAESAQQTKDGGYIIAGEISPEASKLDALLIKTDVNGNELWRKTFKGGFYSVQQTLDGGYIMAGYSLLPMDDKPDALLLRTDVNGDELWNKTFGGGDEEMALSVHQTSDGGYIFTGMTKSYGAGDFDALLIRTDANGNELWNKIFGGKNSDVTSSVHVTADRGYILGGFTESYGAGNYDVWLIKVANESDVRTITVDDSGGADYTRIQDAIDNASDGDTILVYSGTYYENVDVYRQLILRGFDSGGGKPVVDAGRSGSAITLSAGRSTLDGFNAINGNNWPDAGININSNTNIIKNNNASNNFLGIYLWDSSNNTLNSNNALNNTGGIFLNSSSNNTLSGNNAPNNTGGIFLNSSSNNTLSGNNASNNWFGISLGYSSNNTLSGNNASNNHYGILLGYSSNNTLSGNNASNNYNDGIVLDCSSNNIIYNNFFNNTNNSVISNSVSNSVNKWNITKALGINIVGSPFLGGNFWAYPNGIGFSQTCTDSDSDGICDSPYTLDSNNIDYLPLAYKPVTPVWNAFDTGAGTYPSIMGTHNGTLKLNHSINVTRMYTYPSPGTGGHSESAAFYYPNGTLLASGSWSGYSSDWHNITFAPFTLEAGVTYNYTIRTGSYPQIIHKQSHTTADGSTITGSEFIDANGRRYTDWIPAIRLE